MFYHVRQFIFGLDDLDFLSIIDGSSFVNKRVTVRRIYWNRIFGIISNFVEVETVRDKQTLAAALRKVVIERLASVSKKSFVRFFTTRIIRNQKSIFDRLNKLRKTLSIIEEQRIIDEEKSKFEALFKWIESLSFLKKTIALYRRKNKVPLNSFPDVRFVSKLEPSEDGKPVRAQYVPAKNAISIVSSHPLSAIKASFLHELQHWLFESSNLQEWHHTTWYWSELKKLHRQAGILSDYYETEVVPDPQTELDEPENEDTAAEEEQTEEPELIVQSPGPEPQSDSELPVHEDVEI